MYSLLSIDLRKAAALAISQDFPCQEATFIHISLTRIDIMQKHYQLCLYLRMGTKKCLQQPTSGMSDIRYLSTLKNDNPSNSSNDKPYLPSLGTCAPSYASHEHLKPAALKYSLP